MSQAPVDMLPRHLQPGQSASSSSSPTGTPPGSQPRSPALPSSSLPSPALGSSTSSAPLASPGSSTNRFGLALGFIQRRPRGHTNPSSMVSGGRSPGNGSPNGELPPSPGGGERTGGYGFPALRRTLSKRATNGASSPGDGSRSRARRSSSQPPLPVGVDGGDAAARPRTATGETISGLALDAPQPAFAALTASASNPAGNIVSTPTTEGAPALAATGSSDAQSHRLRLVPHLESSRSLHFEPVDRDVQAFQVLRVGRFTDRSHHNNNSDPTRIAFKSKVVSRGHAEIWVDDAGKFFIKDTKSSSGTFLNHIRLSGPNTESRAYPLKDGDVLQLGVDYQGGTEEIYRCVKMRVELNRGWQRSNNAFNTAALAQLRALGGVTPGDDASSTESKGKAVPTPAKKATGPVASVTDCCICLYPVTVCQALFIAPCSHVTHFKCIRPLITQNYPGFCCPLCRTYADLEADVEIEPWEPEEPIAVEAPATVDEEPELPEDDAMSSVEEEVEPVSRAGSRAPSVRLSRRSSAINGVDNTPVPHLPILSGLGRSRPSSLRDEPPASPTSDSPNTPQAIAINTSNHLTPPTESEIYASLASAATPPNSTFLSTLADGRVPRYAPPPVSLGMAMEGGEAGPSTEAHRASFGSEDETDGAKDDEEEGKVVLVVGNGKGKRKAEEDAANEDVPSSVEVGGGKGKQAEGEMDAEVESASGEQEPAAVSV